MRIVPGECTRSRSNRSRAENCGQRGTTAIGIDRLSPDVVISLLTLTPRAQPEVNTQHPARSMSASRSMGAASGWLQTPLVQPFAIDLVFWGAAEHGLRGTLDKVACFQEGRPVADPRRSQSLSSVSAASVARVMMWQATPPSDAPLAPPPPSPPPPPLPVRGNCSRPRSKVRRARGSQLLILSSPLFLWPEARPTQSGTGSARIRECLSSPCRPRLSG